VNKPRVLSIPKPKKKPKKRRGMARPDEPLATYCEVGRVDICTGRAEHRHHRLMRSQGGGDEKANTLDCCTACHRLIHARPSLAYAHGWLLHRSAS
jgi:hypothetical protein